MSWKFAFRYFFSTWEGSHYREVAKEHRFSVATSSHVPLERLDFSPPNHWVAPLWRRKRADVSPELHGPVGRMRLTSYTQFHMTSFELFFRRMWLRMTVNFTQHNREMGFKLDLLFWVLSLFSPSRCPETYLCAVYCLPICPLCCNVSPKSDASAIPPCRSFRIIHDHAVLKEKRV